VSLADKIKNPGLIFIIKFLVLFLGLHFANEAYIGITAPGGLHVPFLEEHLNYVAWIRHSILAGSEIISDAMGYEAYIDGPFHLRSVAGPGVQMVYSCIGLGIMSFWAAFVLAHSIGWKKKLLWTLLGLIIIWIINCFRVAIILVFTVNRWNMNKYMDHHDFFNLVAYFFIFILIVIFIRKQGNMLKSAVTS
jgi:exosortase/archaeosortase family protein